MRESISEITKLVFKALILRSSLITLLQNLKAVTRLYIFSLIPQ